MNTSDTTGLPTKAMESVTVGEQSNVAIKSNIHVETFAVQDPDSFTTMAGNKVIVGTVTFFNKSAMVWIGWGETDEENRPKLQSDNITGEESTTTITNSGIPVMGPMVVAMPRSKYAGIGSEDEAPCSQLISSPNDEEMMLGWQMASRLTRKVGWPIFVSTSLDKNDASLDKVEGMEGFVDSSISYSAALAEKKVAEIILKKKAEIE